MRLYLSSFRLGDRPEYLTDLMHGDGRIAVIANAIDMADPATRSSSVNAELDDLETLGLDPVELDLRTGTSEQQTMDSLAAMDALWVRGGNVFVLRVAMARSGADQAIRALLDQDALTYAGYSAGPCVLAPTLHGLELVDPIEDVRRTYSVEPMWDGLNVLPYWIVPHVDSPDHPESADCNRLRRLYEDEQLPYYALRDGQALVVDGMRTDVV